MSTALCDAPGGMSPQFVADLIAASHLPPPPPPAAASPEYRVLLQTARDLDARGNVIQAADRYLDLVEHFADDEHAREAAIARLTKLYPMGTGHRVHRNLTDTFRKGVSKELRNGGAQQLSERMPVYLAHELLSLEEAAGVQMVAERRRAPWLRHTPRVCFQHDDYTGHPGLRHAFSRLRGEPGNGARGCFTQAASARVAPALPRSDSLFIYRGQEPLIDELSSRVQSRFGLHDTHGTAWQYLTYGEAGTDYGYADHTDCEMRNELHEAGTRIATVLVYLTDDFDGGETDFPRIDLATTAPAGGGLLFYSFGPGWGGTRCALDSLHRSNTVTRGTKAVLQRWYTYAEQPFLASRALRDTANDEGGEPADAWLPFQPVIACDWVQSEKKNVSCRWYNSDASVMGSNES